MTRQAAGQAALWKKGLGEWGQTGERIAQLRKNADLAIYTPGSNAGIPVSILHSFDAPEKELIDDVDLYRERVQATATSILTLLDMDADPVSSREHILISKLLDNAWLTAPANQDILFELPPEQRWQAAAELLGIDLATLSSDSGHA